MNSAENLSPEEYQVHKLAAALEYHFGAVQLVGDMQKIEKVVEHVLSHSKHRSPSRKLWFEAVQEHCQIDEKTRGTWPDHAELNILLFQLLRAYG